MTHGKSAIFMLAILAMIAASCGSRTSSGDVDQAKFTNCKLRASSASVSIGGFPRNSNRIATTGTVNATVILVDFPDAAATLTPAQAYAKISGATSTFSEQSYSRLNYNLNPQLTWFRMSKNSTQYDIKNYAGVLAYVQEAVALADATVNFSTTDTLIVLANPDASGIGSTGPSHPLAPGYGVTADGNEMINLITSAYDLNTWGSIWLNHEATHTMGLVDLYAYSYNGTTSDLIRFTGQHSYMGVNSLSSNSPGLTAWERWVLGWLDDSQMDCVNPLITGQVTTLLTPIEDSGGKKAVVVPVGATKVVVVESRRRKGIDANLAKEGALVYLVDSSVGSGYGPIQVYPHESGDTYFLQSNRAAGEAVTVNGIKVEVLYSSTIGDTVRVSDANNWIQF